MPLADVEFTTNQGSVVARCAGEIDQSNAASLNEALASSLPNQSLALVVDLTDVHYLDSSGIQLIYELREKLRTRGQELRLVIPTGSSAHTALRLAGVIRHVELFESQAEALSPGGAPML